MKYAFAAVLVLGFAGAASAADGSQFVIVKDKNQVEQNLVSEEELGMQVGKQGYPSYDEANIDLRSSATIPKLGERRRGAAPRRGVGPVSTELALFHG